MIICLDFCPSNLPSSLEVEVWLLITEYYIIVTEHYPDSGNKVAEGLKKFFVSLIYDKKCREIMNAILDPKCTCEAAAEKSVSVPPFYSIPVELVSTKYKYPKDWMLVKFDPMTFKYHI